MRIFFKATLIVMLVLMGKISPFLATQNTPPSLHNKQSSKLQLPRVLPNLPSTPNKYPIVDPMASHTTATCATDWSKSPILVLSIDGASVRGIAQFNILRAIENKVNKALSDAARANSAKGEKFNVKRENISDIFDFFAGTSAGSINVGAILIPQNPANSNTDDDPSPKPKFTLDELETRLPATLKAAFATSLFRKIRTMGGLLGTQFSETPLESLLKDYTGQARMSDLVKPAVITSYDLRAREVINFSTYDACQSSVSQVDQQTNQGLEGEDVIKFQPHSPLDFSRKETNVFLWQAMRASSAAPVYYKPFELDINGKSRALIDAGLFVMSPALLAWLEVQKLYPGRRLVIISISSGTLTKDRTVTTNGPIAGNIPSVLKPTIETALEGQQALTDKMMRDLREHGILYHRLSFDVENNEFDDTSEKNIQALKIAAEKTIKSSTFQKAINDIVQVRLQRRKLNDLNPFICKAKVQYKQNLKQPIMPEEKAAIAKMKRAYEQLNQQKTMKK